MAPRSRPPMPSFSRIIFLSSLLAVTEAHIRARLVPQERAAYEGGWALALPGASCPSDAPVACDTNDATVNPTCCPSGQTCFGLLDPHCCPTNADCQNVVENLPVCANSTWNMYELDLDARSFFCCEPGQYGVLPVSGYAGICEPNDLVVASSLIATAASQVGGTAVATGNGNTGGAAATSTVTSTMKNGGITTITTTLGGATATATQTGNGATSTGGSTSSNPISTISNKTGLSTGAIVGIAVGAFALLLIALVAFWACRRKRNSRYNGENQGPPGSGAPVYSAVPQPYQSPAPEYKSPVVRYGAPAPQAGYGVSPPPQGYGPTQPPVQQYGGPPPVEAPQGWEERAEMGPGR